MTPHDAQSTRTSESGTRTVHRMCPPCEACCGRELKVSTNKVSAFRAMKQTR